MTLYWDKTFLKLQQDTFNKQILLAKKYHLPIVIHCRNAFDEVFEILNDHKGDSLYGVFHCFSPSSLNVHTNRQFSLLI